MCDFTKHMEGLRVLGKLIVEKNRQIDGQLVLEEDSELIVRGDLEVSRDIVVCRDSRLEVIGGLNATSIHIADGGSLVVHESANVDTRFVMGHSSRVGLLKSLTVNGEIEAKSIGGLSINGELFCLTLTVTKTKDFVVHGRMQLGGNLSLVGSELLVNNDASMRLAYLTQRSCLRSNSCLIDGGLVVVQSSIDINKDLIINGNLNTHTNGIVKSSYLKLNGDLTSHSSSIELDACKIIGGVILTRSSKLGVRGDALLETSLRVKGGSNVSVSKLLRVNESIILKSLGIIKTSNDLLCGGRVFTFEGSEVGVGGDMTVTEYLENCGDIHVRGNLTVNIDLMVAGTLDVDHDLKVGYDLTTIVNSSTIVLGNVTVGNEEPLTKPYSKMSLGLSWGAPPGKMVTNGYMKVCSDILVEGNVEASNLEVSSIEVKRSMDSRDGSMIVSDKVLVKGEAIVEGDISLADHSTLEIKGNAKIGENIRLGSYSKLQVSRTCSNRGLLALPKSTASVKNGLVVDGPLRVGYGASLFVESNMTVTGDCNLGVKCVEVGDYPGSLCRGVNIGGLETLQGEKGTSKMSNVEVKGDIVVGREMNLDKVVLSCLNLFPTRKVNSRVSAIINVVGEVR